MLDTYKIHKALDDKATSNIDFFGLALALIAVDITFTLISGSSELTSVGSSVTLFVFGVLSTINSYNKQQ
jgi:hypothetical protein